MTILDAIKARRVAPAKAAAGRHVRVARNRLLSPFNDLKLQSTKGET